MRRATRRFLPGETFDAALAAAVGFKAQGVGAVFTELGENIKVLSDALAVVEHYEKVLAAAASAGVDPEISVKPTQLGLDIDAGAAYANLERLARSASDVKGFLWVDMEGSAYTEPTLELYRRLRREHPGVGVCLQAYLFRTAGDIARLMPLKPAIRLVKGAYAETADRAFPAKVDVDANYLALCTLMLPEVKRHRLRLVMGTHDVPLISRVTRFSDALGVDRSNMEVHMLYGIQAAQQVRLVGDGYRVKDLVAYGDAWYPWYLRRLAERPANVLFVARQMFS
ncbi:MAG TPA: proline dehydrogenase family protein [Candidatus Dormibacteraeota bacterium]|nr:proline dehydrogenase family protein [Candidatus Dormibacteraeota bacterium]